MKDMKKVNAYHQPDGLIETIKKNIFPRNTWGTEDDIKQILGKLITSTGNAVKTETNNSFILPPVSMPSENDVRDIRIVYQTQILEVLRKNKGQSLTLLTPLCENGRHWYLGIARIENNKISLEIWNSMPGALPKKIENAFQNMKKEMRSLNYNMQLKYTPSHTQQNGFSCMDYCVQKALQIYQATTKRLPESFNAIHNAANSTQLRQSIVEKIGPLRVKNKIDSKEKTHQLKVENNIESEIDNLLDVKSKQSSEDKIADQIRFDELLARNLSQLYQTMPHKNEAELVQQAQTKAIQQFKFFKESNPSENKSSNSNIKKRLRF